MLTSAAESNTVSVLTANAVQAMTRNHPIPETRRGNKKADNGMSAAPGELEIIYFFSLIIFVTSGSTPSVSSLMALALLDTKRTSIHLAALPRPEWSGWCPCTVAARGTSFEGGLHCSDRGVSVNPYLQVLHIDFVPLHSSRLYTLNLLSLREESAITVDCCEVVG